MAADNVLDVGGVVNQSPSAHFSNCIVFIMDCFKPLLTFISRHGLKRLGASGSCMSSTDVGSVMWASSKISSMILASEASPSNRIPLLISLQAFATVSLIAP